MGSRPASPRRRFLIRAALVVAATLVALALAELLCRAIFGSPGARWDVAAGLRRDEPEPDAVLGLRMATNAPGHDARGFRNAAAPVQADLVAIGDSHTWGTNARIDEAWPQVLGRSLGRTAYNLALGGYGPIQYEALAEEALTLRPSVIIVAVYLGNDLWDAYVRVWSDDRYRDRRKTDGADLSTDTVGPAVSAVGRRRKSYERPVGVAWLQRRLALAQLATRAGLLDDRGYEVELAGNRAWLAACPQDGFIFDTAGASTGLTTSYRLPAIDLSEPRIAEGLRLTRDALARIHSICQGAEVHLLVASVPTKESVYYAAVKSARRDPDPGYERVVAAESRVSGDLDAFCQDRGIAFHDLLPVLRKGLQDGTQLYPATADGHPLPAGYAIYAFSLEAELRRRGW